MPAFRRVLRENAIKDLRKLGVTVVGDRRKMLTTIGNYSALLLSPLEAKKKFL
jgi:hypothetical protein